VVKILADELGPAGIRTNGLLPVRIATERFVSSMPSAAILKGSVPASPWHGGVGSRPGRGRPGVAGWWPGAEAALTSGTPTA
jgi:NAD(P)-dependent dehydrogenase (short-subunit alcohol dehydrogenase family)